MAYRFPLLTILVFAFSILLVNAQENQVMVKDSISTNTPSLSNRSFVVIKASMDSILTRALNDHYQLQDELDVLDKTIADSTDETENKTLQEQRKELLKRIDKMRNNRREAIDLQLKLTYNPTSLELGNKVVKFLKDRYDIDVPIKSTTKVKQTNKAFYFEVEKPSEIVYDAPCNLVFNGRDYELNKDRIETESLPFFTYTNPKLKTYFKEKDFLSCSASMVKLDKDYLVNLDIQIASKDAPRSYGYIERSAVIMFEFINGERVYGEAIRRANGIVNKEATLTNYDVFFKIDKSARKELYKKELSKIGLFWSTGFEKYNIFEVDLLMNHLRCIND